MNVIVEFDVFYDGAEPDGVVYIRFFFGVESYNSRVAASFKIENAFVTSKTRLRPTYLIISNE